MLAWPSVYVLARTERVWLRNGNGYWRSHGQGNVPDQSEAQLPLAVKAVYTTAKLPVLSTRKCYQGNAYRCMYVSVSARHVSRGEIPPKTPTPPHGNLLQVAISWKSYFAIRVAYTKKPFIPDAVPGLKLAKTAHMLLGLCAPDPLEKQLTALLISHGRDIQRV